MKKVEMSEEADATKDVATPVISDVEATEEEEAIARVEADVEDAWTKLALDEPPACSTVVWNKQECRSKYWTTRSSVHLFVRLLRTARFARALRCANSIARLFTSLTPTLVGK